MSADSGMTSSVVASLGDIVLEIGRDIVLTGGTAATSPAAIRADAGNMAITVGRDVNLTGGMGFNSFAQIGSPAGVGIIYFPVVGRSVLINGDSYALIGHGPTGAVLTGDIIFDFIGSNVVLTGSMIPAVVNGFAQIGHVNQAGIGVTINGDIYINAAGTISLNGGLGGATADDTRARIGHGGVPSIVAPTIMSEDITIFAGSGVSLATNIGQAQIENLATNPGSGAITLVLDNANPLNPSSGAGSFQMNTGSLLANNFGASGGEVRIYAVDPAQNILSANLNINGVIFNSSGGPPDNTYEKYSVYYGSGPYGGPEFNLFYKLPIIVCICPSSGGCPSSAAALFSLPLYDLAIANTQLTDMLAIFEDTKYYHGQVGNMRKGTKPDCLKQEKDNCASYNPNYRRFYTFIPENRVY